MCWFLLSPGPFIVWTRIHSFHIYCRIKSDLQNVEMIHSIRIISHNCITFSIWPHSLDKTMYFKEPFQDEDFSETGNLLSLSFLNCGLKNFVTMIRKSTRNCCCIISVQCHSWQLPLSRFPKLVPCFKWWKIFMEFIHTKAINRFSFFPAITFRRTIALQYTIQFINFLSNLNKNYNRLNDSLIMTL